MKYGVCSCVLAFGALAILGPVGCGGSASETPPPLEPDWSKISRSSRTTTPPPKQVDEEDLEEEDIEDLDDEPPPARDTWGGGRKKPPPR